MFTYPYMTALLQDLCSVAPSMTMKRKRFKVHHAKGSAGCQSPTNFRKKFKVLPSPTQPILTETTKPGSVFLDVDGGEKEPG